MRVRKSGRRKISWGQLCRLRTDGLVRNRQPLIDDGQTFLQLRFRDDERWVREEGVEAHERVEALLPKEAAEGRHLLRRAVVRRHRLVRLPVAPDLPAAQEADVALRADRRGPPRELPPPPLHTSSPPPPPAA